MMMMILVVMVVVMMAMIGTTSWLLSFGRRSSDLAVDSSKGFLGLFEMDVFTFWTIGAKIIYQ